MYSVYCIWTLFADSVQLLDQIFLKNGHALLFSWWIIIVTCVLVPKYLYLLLPDTILMIFFHIIMFCHCSYALLRFIALLPLGCIYTGRKIRFFFCPHLTPIGIWCTRVNTKDPLFPYPIWAFSKCGLNTDIRFSLSVTSVFHDGLRWMSSFRTGLHLQDMPWRKYTRLKASLVYVKILYPFLLVKGIDLVPPLLPP